MPADRHGPAARPRRRQRARGRRGARHACAATGRRTSPSSCSTRARGCSRYSDLGIDVEEGRRRAEAAVADGSALETYERWIRAQGGDPDPAALERAPVQRPVPAPRDGVVTRRRRARRRPRGAGARRGPAEEGRPRRPRGRRPLLREARRHGPRGRRPRRGPRARRRGRRAGRRRRARGLRARRRGAGRRGILLDVVD